MSNLNGDRTSSIDLLASPQVKIRGVMGVRQSTSRAAKLCGIFKASMRSKGNAIRLLVLIDVMAK